MVHTDLSASQGELGSHETEVAPINPRHSPAGRGPPRAQILTRPALCSGAFQATCPQ